MIAVNRWQTFSHSVAFVLGFSTVFVILGASVAFFGYALNQYLPTFVKLGGLMLILFGLQIIGLFGWIADGLRRKGWDDTLPGRAFIWFTDTMSRLMYTEGRVQVNTQRSVSYFSSFLMGVFFSAGWIPCVGPVLAAIYFLASDTQTVAQGALLLGVYSMGLGIPFLDHRADVQLDHAVSETDEPASGHRLQGDGRVPDRRRRNAFHGSDVVAL